MTRAALIAEHLRIQRFYLDSLSREERKQDRKYVMEIQAVRYLRRITASLALANLRIDVQAAETKTALGVLDQRVAKLAREI